MVYNWCKTIFFRCSQHTLSYCSERTYCLHGAKSKKCEILSTLFRPFRVWMRRDYDSYISEIRYWS